jgi:hypothetical protein
VTDLQDKSDNIHTNNGKDIPSIPASSSSPPHPVQVLSQLTRHIIIDDSFDTLDIKASRGQVCRHQKFSQSVSELLKCFETLFKVVGDR